MVEGGCIPAGNGDPGIRGQTARSVIMVRPGGGAADMVTERDGIPGGQARRAAVRCAIVNQPVGRGDVPDRSVAPVSVSACSPTGYGRSALPFRAEYWSDPQAFVSRGYTIS